MAIFHLSFCIPIHFERKQPGLIRGRDRNGCQTNKMYESFINFNRFTEGADWPKDDAFTPFCLMKSLNRHFSLRCDVAAHNATDATALFTSRFANASRPVCRIHHLLRRSASVSLGASWGSWTPAASLPPCLLPAKCSSAPVSPHSCCIRPLRLPCPRYRSVRARYVRSVVAQG
jgi:hypothetical protein